MFPTTADSKLVLELDGTEFALADATRQTNFYAWSSHGLTWAENQSVTVKLTTSDPGVSSIALTSDPNDDSRTGNDDTYAIGDDIEATLTFNQAVDVTGSPQITLTIGSSEKAASCAAATNTTTVVCSYTVAQGNNAPDGVGVKANSLALNGGTIRKESSTTDNAFLGHDRGCSQFPAQGRWHQAHAHHHRRRCTEDFDRRHAGLSEVQRGSQQHGHRRVSVYRSYHSSGSGQHRHDHISDDQQRRPRNPYARRSRERQQHACYRNSPRSRDRPRRQHIKPETP